MGSEREERKMGKIAGWGRRKERGGVESEKGSGLWDGEGEGRKGRWVRWGGGGEGQKRM